MSEVDLKQFMTAEPPSAEPFAGTGRPAVWPDRLRACHEQGPGLWVNATAAWGTSVYSGSNVKAAAYASGLTVEVRTNHGALWIKVS